MRSLRKEKKLTSKIQTSKRLVVEVDVDKFDISSNKPSDIGVFLSWFSIISQNICIPGSTFCTPYP